MKLLLTILFCLMVFPAVGNAQFLESISNVNIKTVPAYPEPNTEVTASLDAYSYNTDGAVIKWFLDGIEEIAARNNREVAFTTRDLGEELTLTVQILLIDGQTLTATRKIIPSRVDIVIEADTIVPTFYKGKPLPSSGSTIRAIALPATAANPNSLTYKWSMNNKVLFGGSLVGKSVATIEAPQGGDILLSVEVGGTNGAILTKKTTRIRVFEPKIRFYEDNQLRALSRNAIKNPLQLIGDEITVRAEPYYMASSIFQENPLTEWEVNGSTIENPNDDQQVITLRSGGGSGRFTVDFHIRNLQNLLQGAREDFVVAF